MYIPASIVYGVTGSSLAIDTINQVLPFWNYNHLISWLFKVHATDNSDDSVDLDSFSLFYAFDNNQRLLRSWLARNFNEQVVQIMTYICRVRVNDVSKIQFKENPHPSSWRKVSNISRSEFHTYKHSSDVATSYNEFVSNYISKTKRRRSDPVLWQKPLYQQKCQRGKVTTQTTPQKSSIKQQLRTDLGRSVGVTTATQLVWLTGLRAHLPTPRKSRVIKRTHFINDI